MCVYFSIDVNCFETPPVVLIKHNYLDIWRGINRMVCGSIFKWCIRVLSLPAWMAAKYTAHAWGHESIMYHTLTGFEKSGNGGAPNAGRIDTIVSTMAVNGRNIARHTAMVSCFVNLQSKCNWVIRSRTLN